MREGPANAIVMDIVLPGMDGNELIQWLAKEDCSASIILISGYGGKYISMREALGKLHKLNILVSLAKHVRFDVLEIILKKALQLPDDAIDNGRLGSGAAEISGHQIPERPCRVWVYYQAP